MPTVDPIREACARLDSNSVYYNRLLAMYELDATMSDQERAEVEGIEKDRKR